MALWAVGAVINVIGSILINLGTNVIKLGHTRTATLAEGPQPKLLRAPKRWWRTPGSKMWLLGMTAFSIGNLLNFASFAFAAQSLLSALGVVQFISNIVFGRFVNKEKVTKRVVFATVVVCGGCVLLVLFGNHESPTLSTHDMLELYTHALYIVYLCFIFTTSPLMYAVYRHGKRAVLADHTGAAAKKWARWLPISYALFAGLLGTQSVLYGKTMSMLLRTTFTGDSQFDHWYTWLSILLFLFFAGFWMSRYSKAMKLFPVLIIMPIIQIVWVLFSMISGSLYYQEYKTLTALSGSMFALGMVVLLVGVYLLTGGQAAMQPRQQLKAVAELTEEERERGEELDQEALRSKAPLSDNLDTVVEVSTAADLLEPEEALVARKLSTVYDNQGPQLLGSGGSAATAAAAPPLRPASAPAARDGSALPRVRPRWASSTGDGAAGGIYEGSASEESGTQLVQAGAADSTSLDASPWPAVVANGGVAGAAREGSTRSRPLTEVVVSRVSEGDEEEGAAGPGGRGSSALSGGSEEVSSSSGMAGAGTGAGTGRAVPPPLPASLMHDLRTDWGVGMRDLNAVVRASVGLPQDDPEGTAFSIWSMPMACSASFTGGAGPARARSLELPQSATFRIRSAFEQQQQQQQQQQQLSGGSRGAGGGAPSRTTDDLYARGGGGAGASGATPRVQRPGHRRINRSRSANELDDMLRAAALGEDVDIAGPGLSPLGPGLGQASSGQGQAGWAGRGPEFDVESLGSPWRGGSTTTAGAAGTSTAAAAGASPGEVSSRAAGGTGGAARGLPVHHRHHPSSGSAPVLSTTALLGGGCEAGGSGAGGRATSPAVPFAASADVQMLSAAGSAPRRPWAADAAAGISPSVSQVSQVDESEGPDDASLPLQEGGLPVSDFLSSMSMSMSLSPPGSQGNMSALAARVRQQAGKKGDKAS